MKQFQYTIKDELGIHARPAGLLVKKASEFKSTVSVDNGTQKGDAEKNMSLMMMAVKQGPTRTFTIEGEGEAAPAGTRETFMQENLGKLPARRPAGAGCRSVWAQGRRPYGFFCYSSRQSLGNK